MDVATLVRNITTAYEDALGLVQGIRQRKEKDPGYNVQVIDDLLGSLSLGPTVVRGCYESDARRFGDRYTVGDATAKEQLKDALINLQLAVMSNLRAVMYDEKDPDYDEIQAASDDCRVNVGVCLGQLSQRISRAARANNNAGRVVPPENGQSKPMQRSGSHGTHSTHSSGQLRSTPMTPPESDTEHLGDSDMGMSRGGQRFNTYPPGLDVMDGMHTASYAGLYSPPQDNATWAPISHSRASSSTLPSNMDSPINPPDALHPNSNRHREWSFSTNNSTSGRIQIGMLQTRSNQDSSGLAESPTYNPAGYFNHQQQLDTTRGSPYSSLTSATLGRDSGSNLVRVDRNLPGYLDSSHTTQSPLSPLDYARGSMFDETEKEVYVPPPPSIPARSQSRREPAPLFHSYRTDSTYSIAETGTSSQNPIGPLTLPTDKNLLGFCKGAFRLQAGMEKKAFVIANRPLGYSSMLQYWKCDKCYFEGTLTSVIPPGGKKPERVFDPIIHDHSGIRYKWVFLAKCHVSLKTMPEGRRDGLYGSFCCIFCIAEGAQRGWPKHTNDSVVGDRSSVHSSNSGDLKMKGNLSGPVFGNIHGFMDHLQMHRQREYWPGVEMQSRMKCIVGRHIQRGEDFDINLPPLLS